MPEQKDRESKYRMLDLFSGLGGASQAMEEDDKWNVVTVDVEERFNPDICEDVLDLGADDFKGEFDLIWASPPCNAFTMVVLHHHWEEGYPIPSTEEAVNRVRLVFHTLWLINQIDPDYWFMENPMALLRKIIGEPEATITYCQYGHDYMKPTDLWGEHPPGFPYRRCHNGDDCHVNSTRDGHNGIKDNLTSEERAKVPMGLSKAVKEAVENPKKNTLKEMIPNA